MTNTNAVLFSLSIYLSLDGLLKVHHDIILKCPLSKIQVKAFAFCYLYYFHQSIVYTVPH